MIRCVCPPDIRSPAWEMQAETVGHVLFREKARARIPNDETVAIFHRPHPEPEAKRCQVKDARE